MHQGLPAGTEAAPGAADGACCPLLALVLSTSAPPCSSVPAQGSLHRDRQTRHNLLRFPLLSLMSYVGVWAPPSQSAPPVSRMLCHSQGCAENSPVPANCFGMWAAGKQPGSALSYTIPLLSSESPSCRCAFTVAFLQPRTKDSSLRGVSHMQCLVFIKTEAVSLFLKAQYKPEPRSGNSPAALEPGTEGSGWSQRLFASFSTFLSLCEQT